VYRGLKGREMVDDVAVDDVAWRTPSICLLFGQ
jgi:hypothetical protein